MSFFIPSLSVCRYALRFITFPVSRFIVSYNSFRYRPANWIITVLKIMHRPSFDIQKLPKCIFSLNVCPKLFVNFTNSSYLFSSRITVPVVFTMWKQQLFKFVRFQLSQQMETVLLWHIVKSRDAEPWHFWSAPAPAPAPGKQSGSGSGSGSK